MKATITTTTITKTTNTLKKSRRRKYKKLENDEAVENIATGKNREIRS